MKKSYIVVLLSSLVFLTAFAPAKIIKKDYEFNAKKDRGLVLMSARLNDLCGKVGIAQIISRNKTGEGSITAAIGIWGQKMDFQNPEGVFTVFETKSGHYEISSIMLTGMKLAARNNKEETGFFFDVQPNVATYVGEIELTIDKGCDNYSIKVNDEWDRDSQIFKQRVTNINVDDVKKSIAVKEN